MEQKVKSIRRFTLKFSRKSAFDDAVVETKIQTSYAVFDERGNLVSDISYDEEGQPVNRIERTFSPNNLLINEKFFNAEEEVPYESRTYSYDDNRVMTTCLVDYDGQTVEERFCATPEGLLLTKEVDFGDGEPSLEMECEWEKGKIIKIVEYDDGDVSSIKQFSYDANGDLEEQVVEEPILRDRHREVFENSPAGVLVHTRYNLNDDPISVVRNCYNDKQQLIGKIIETQTSFVKYIYAYNEQGKLVRESMLNKDDVLLNDYHYLYNEQGLEVEKQEYSKNIVDKIDELIHVRTDLSDYEFFQ